MSIETQEYWSYRKEFNYPLSRDKCKEKLHNIFRSYRKETLYGLIGHIAINFGIENNREMITRIQNELFGYDIKKNLIHRGAINVLYELVLDFNNFSPSDTRGRLEVKDLEGIFLLINEFWDIEYDDLLKYEDIGDTKRMIFHAVKLLYGIHNPEDIQSKSFYFLKIYEEINDNKIFAKEIETFENIFEIKMNQYIEILRNMSNTKDNKKTINFLKDKFTTNISELEIKWQNRTPNIPSPFDFKFLLDYPVLEIGNKQYVINAYYLFMAIIMKCYFILSNPKTAPKFRENVTKYVFEKIVTEFLTKIFIGEDVSRIITLKNKNNEYADWGMIYKNIIFLFEIKSGTLSVQNKYGNNIYSFFEELSKKYIEKQGVNQQIKRLMDIDNNWDYFCNCCNLTQGKKYIICPTLILYDDIFELPGINIYMREKYFEKLRLNNFKPKNFILCANNAIISYTDLFALSNKKMKSYNKKVEKFIGYFNYNLPFRTYLEDEWSIDQGKQ